MCAVFRRERPAESEPNGLSQALDLAFSAAEGDWFVTASCSSCGGYRMGLQVSDPAHGELAESRARAFITRVHSRGGCLGCEARTWREQPAPASGEPHVWWDTDTGQWMAYGQPAGLADGLSLPLGIDTFWAPQEVRAAARALWSADRQPLRVACDIGEVDRAASTIFYDVESGRWKLHAACFDCGGFELRLTSFGRGAVEAACDEALSCLDLIAREGCPHCRTARERGALRDADHEPRIWFDTETRDWLVWQAVEGCDEGVTLPLGINRFDARRAVIYRAAASLLFDSELFLDEGL